jgi:hypothetical protein
LITNSQQKDQLESQLRGVTLTLSEAKAQFPTSDQSMTLQEALFGAADGAGVDITTLSCPPAKPETQGTITYQVFMVTVGIQGQMESLLRFVGTLGLVLHFFDSGGVEGREEFGGGGLVEEGVGGVDEDEESVGGDSAEAVGFEEGVVEHGEVVEGEHAEDGGESGAKDGAFEDDGDEGGNAEEGFAGDDEGVIEGVGEPLECESGEEADESTGEDDPGEDGGRASDDVVEAVDGERGVDVEAGVTGLADASGGGDDGVDGVELGK